MLNESFSNKGIMNMCRIATLPAECADSIAAVGLIEPADMVIKRQTEQVLGLCARGVMIDDVFAFSASDIVAHVRQSLFHRE